MGLVLLVVDLAGEAVLDVAFLATNALGLGREESLTLASTFGGTALSFNTFEVILLADDVPGLAALAVVFFFLTAGLLSVDPVDDFLLTGAFLEVVAGIATAVEAVAGFTVAGLEDVAEVGSTGFGGMTLWPILIT